MHYVQFQRLKRICDKESESGRKVEEMELRFIQRGYDKKLVHKAKGRAKDQRRETLLQTRIPEQTSNSLLHS